MKSERAKRIIAVNARDRRDEVIATKAVELAEEDARERAVRTMCEFIRPFVEDHALEKCERECAGCEWRNEFLEYYDNGTFRNS